MNEKISFTEQIRIALSKPLWYKSLFQQSVGKHISYFLMLIVLITVIRFVIPTTAYLQSVGGLKNLIMEGIPTFQFANGELDMENTIDLERNGVRLMIDTSVDAFTLEDANGAAAEMEDSMPLVYMVSKTNIVCNMIETPFDLSTMGDITFNNQILYDIAPTYLIVYGVAIFFSNIAAYLASALFFALFGYFMNKALKLNLKFGQIYVIAMYAKSIEILLESVLQVAGFSFLYYIGSVIGIFITCNYMTRGMSSLLIPSVKSKDDESDRPRFFY